MLTHSLRRPKMLGLVRACAGLAGAAAVWQVTAPAPVLHLDHKHRLVLQNAGLSPMYITALTLVPDPGPAQVVTRFRWVPAKASVVVDRDVQPQPPTLGSITYSLSDTGLLSLPPFTYTKQLEAFECPE